MYLSRSYGLTGDFFRLAAMLGMDSVSGSSLAAMVHPSDLARVEALSRALLTEPAVVELRLFNGACYVAARFYCSPWDDGFSALTVEEIGAAPAPLRRTRPAAPLRLLQGQIAR